MSTESLQTRTEISTNTGVREVIGNIAGNIADNIAENISEHVREITDGVVQLDSILKGQIKIDGNGYIDQLLTLLTVKMKEKQLDSFNLPDQTMNFEKPVACGILLPGQAFLRDGIIGGLASFCRFDETVVQIDALGDPIISTVVAIGVKRAAVDYAVKVLVFCFEEDVAVNGSLDDVQITMGLKIGRNLAVSLDRFDVHSSGDLNMNFDNLGMFDSIADSLLEDLQRTIKEEVLKYCNKGVREVVNDIIKNLPLQL